MFCLFYAINFGATLFQNRLYEVDFAGATDVSVFPSGLIGKTYTPVAKQLLWLGDVGNAKRIVDAARAYVPRFHGRSAGPASTSPCLKPVSASAFENFCASENRSAGSFSCAFRIAASTCAGIEGRDSVGARASSVRIFARTA